MDALAHDPRHPIAVVAERTGLSLDVLRAWERRYSAVTPSRSQGGQRLYSDADVERLRLIHAASSAGRSIGQVAAMSTEALSALAAEDASVRSAVPPQAHSLRAAETLDAAVAHTRALQSAALAGELRRAATSLGVASFVDQVAAPLMRRIGDEWHAGSLTIAQEHLATAVLRDLLVETMRGFSAPPGAERIVVATPAGERHEIGAAIVGASAAAEGFNVIYLGADLPAADIVAATRAAGARVVALSIVYAEERRRLLDEVRRIREALPPDIRLIIGGAGAHSMASPLRALGVEISQRIDRPGKELAPGGDRGWYSRG